MNPIPSGEKFTHDIATEVIVQHRQTHEGQEDQAWTQQAELRNKQNKVNMSKKCGPVTKHVNFPDVMSSHSPPGERPSWSQPKNSNL